MLAGRAVRGVFTRIASLGTGGGSRALLRMAPKTKMDAGSITLGRLLGNSNTHGMVPGWNAPSPKAMQHMMTLGGFGSTPLGPQKYSIGTPFFTFAKKRGLQPNHASTDGLSFALFKGRHANLL